MDLAERGWKGSNGGYLKLKSDVPSGCGFRRRDPCSNRYSAEEKPLLVVGVVIYEVVGTILWPRLEHMILNGNSESVNN